MSTGKGSKKRTDTKKKSKLDAAVTLKAVVQLPDEINLFVSLEDLQASHRTLSDGPVVLALRKLGYDRITCSPNLVIISNGQEAKQYITDEDAANAIGCFLNKVEIQPFEVRLRLLTEDALEDRWKRIREAWNESEQPIS